MDKGKSCGAIFHDLIKSNIDTVRKEEKNEIFG